jgi:hypothetical protein
MAKFIFISDNRAINLESVAYVDFEVGEEKSTGVVLVGSQSETYDLKLVGEEAEKFLLALEAAG